MKRKPSQEMFSSDITTKPTVKRLKSPQSKRLPPKKEEESAASMLSRHRINRSRESAKVDSNNTTVSARPKSHKSIKLARHKSEKLGQHQIMNIISLFASKIQRQWRVYLFRKRINEFISEKISKRASKQRSSLQRKLQLGQNKIRHMAKFAEEFNQSQEDNYDREKYKELSPLKANKDKKKSSIKAKPVPSLNNCSKEWQKLSGTSKSCSVTPRNGREEKPVSKTPREVHQNVVNTSKSLEKPNSAENLLEFIKGKEQRRASFNSQEAQKLSQNRRHSTGDLSIPLISRNQLKIGKAFELYIQQPKYPPKLSESSLQQSRRIQKTDNEGAIAFGKFPLDEMKGHVRKELQLSKFKQLISAQNRYKKNEVTYRSYLEIVGKIKEEHSNKLKEIKRKEGELKSTWNQLLALYKNNHLKFTQDQNNHSHLDVSVSFQRWDFNSSAKKSIDCFDLPEQSSKILSIESVLRELEEEDNEGRVQRVQEEKQFKKNKSLKAIETIDERSKEISEKDAFDETPERKNQRLIAVHQISERERTEMQEQTHERIQFQAEDKSSNNVQFHANHQHVYPTQYEATKYLSAEQEKQQRGQEKRTTNKQPDISFEIDPLKVEKAEDLADWVSPSTKKLDEVPDSQSLLITPASGSHPLIISQDQIQPLNNKTTAVTLQSLQSPQICKNDLIFRQAASAEPNEFHALVSKFRELVIERMVMTNIKLINSLKFVCARAGEQRKRLKLAKSQLIPIQTDMNALNTWLLEISHFVLDNYQKMVRDNLVEVRQPPAHELLAMARKGHDLIPVYETIQEYAFKDFQFYYIKTLARNLGIPPQTYDRFSTLTYTFHRVLVDSLNTALMQELVTGRIWILTPWHVPRKYKANRICVQQAKLSLQRSINVVSNWGEYGLGKLVSQEDVTEAEHRQYEEEKINLVCRQEVLQLNFCFIFSLGYVLLELAAKVVEEEWQLAASQILALRN